MVPVLYASTWLLTAFACPFPPAFSGRVIDVMLTEGRTHVLLRAALAVMLSCAEDLLALDDFEALITHLKVRWAEMHDWVHADRAAALQGTLRSRSELLDQLPCAGLVDAAEVTSAVCEHACSCSVADVLWLGMPASFLCVVHRKPQGGSWAVMDT